ncbi:Uncharacterised protein [Mycobacteroides abscessus subsp. massiliense]|nr:Uncharacterised protein [Mycobacteroides abscessus subsp. massiliense]
MLGEQFDVLFQAVRVGVVAHDGVDLELLGGDFQLVGIGAGDDHPMAGVAELRSHRPADLVNRSGYQYVHGGTFLTFLQALPIRSCCQA